ncbi:IclR family transcriptional regulator [Desulfomarina profundi]|uniref:IclR family transcriptional regulator n=1 Tax=Desulfomarina profundi TaxID=2772557 RepID=A0A8D5FMC9_9BACT|nr:IclR family transcriptional regulator [Desulfomarina profundi]BCL63196.1 IclR family transcriptional regulator [Desulfomarina profundi]
MENSNQQQEKPANSSSAEKALNILLAFAPYNNEMGTTELSRKLGIHKSTTSRLIKLLVATNFLQQNPITRKYMLGKSALKIGTATTRSINSKLLVIAQPYLTELSQMMGESVALEMLSGTNVVLALHVEGPSHIRFNFQQGEQVPINVAAGAKVILSHSDPKFLELCLQQKFTRFNENTIVTRKDYLNLLKEIKQTGIAYDRGERYRDTHAMAAAIHSPDGAPKAAVVIAGPAFRMTSDFLETAIPTLRETAKKISNHLF